MAKDHNIKVIGEDTNDAGVLKHPVDRIKTWALVNPCLLQASAPTSEQIIFLYF